MECALKYESLGYRRKEPEQNLLHQVLREHLETFLDRAVTAEFFSPGHGNLFLLQWTYGERLPSEIPEIRPARPPPQLDFEYDDPDTKYAADW